MCRDKDVHVAAVAAAVVENQLEQFVPAVVSLSVQLGAIADTCVCQVQLQAAQQDQWIVLKKKHTAIVILCQQLCNVAYAAFNLQRSKSHQLSLLSPCQQGFLQYGLLASVRSMQAWWTIVHNLANLLCCQQPGGHISCMTKQNAARQKQLAAKRQWKSAFQHVKHSQQQ
jgi:hypothetical protein